MCVCVGTHVRLMYDHDEESFFRILLLVLIFAPIISAEREPLRISTHLHTIINTIGLPLRQWTSMAHQKMTTSLALSVATWTECYWRNLPRSQTFLQSPPRSACRCLNLADQERPAFPRCHDAVCTSSNNMVQPGE